MNKSKYKSAFVFRMGIIANGWRKIACMSIGKHRKTADIISGSAIGAICGAFGGGGGALSISLLKKGGLDANRAHATTLALVFPLGVASLVGYYLKGGVDLSVAPYTSVGTAVGSAIGAMLLKKVPAEALGFIFSFLMGASGIYMLLIGMK